MRLPGGGMWWWWWQPTLVLALGKGFSFKAFCLKGHPLPDPSLSFTISTLLCRRSSGSCSHSWSISCSCYIGSWTFTCTSKSCIRRFVITEKAPKMGLFRDYKPSDGPFWSTNIYTLINWLLIVIQHVTLTLPLSMHASTSSAISSIIVSWQL